MRRANDGTWIFVGALLLIGCIPSPPEVVPHGDGSTGPAEGTTSTSEPPLPTSAGSTTAQADGTGSATGTDTSDSGTTQGAQPSTSTGDATSTGGTSTSGDPGTSTGDAASTGGTSTSGDPGTSTGDAASTGGTSTSGEPGTSTGAPPSCDELFGAAPGYIYCTETDMACHFNATTGGSDCNAMCMSLGSSCVAAFDNPNVAGQECDVIPPNMDTCDTDRGTEICACAR